MELTGRTALVTGASRGLGLALARALAHEGVKVVLVARDRAALDAAAAAIRAGGGVAHAVPGDLGEKRAIHAIAGSAAALVGPIDIAILNASTLGPLPMPLLLDTECEDLERVLAVNLVGPFRLAKVLAGSMVVRGQGTVIAVSSDAAIDAYPRWGAYSVSKAALDHLTRIWARELEGTAVRFLSVDPGEMDTRMHADALPDADRATLADPAVVAARIVAILRSGSARSGDRIRAAAFEADPVRP
jgi:NAD(P)-dependent dehydrogenase (short-subunit alcohol dehydrogenase family)